MGAAAAARPARRIQVGLPGLVKRAITDPAGPRQLPGVGRGGIQAAGQAKPGSRRREHEEMADGDAGMTTPLVHLSRSAASKIDNSAPEEMPCEGWGEVRVQDSQLLSGASK